MSDPKRADEAFTAGIVHDVGKIVVALGMPDKLKETMRMCRERRAPLHAVEREVMGITHAQLGAFLLGSWGLPYPIVDAVAYHHQPSLLPGSGFDVLAAVHIADALTDQGSDDQRAPSEPDGQLDFAFLESVGHADELSVWRRMAAEEISAMERT